MALSCIACAAMAFAEQKTEHFGREPEWHAVNNRPVQPPREVVQDFGWSGTTHSGDSPGEIGGFVTPAAEPAYYAMPIEAKTFEHPLSASGVLLSPEGGYHLLLGFFNHETINEWRTPNSIALRLSGRGNAFYAWLEYCTSRWRAGGDSPKGFQTPPDPESGRSSQLELPADTVLPWSLTYDPNANNGAGSIAARIGDVEAVCHLEPEHRAEGATMTRFGILNVIKSIDGAGSIWIRNLVVNGEQQNLSNDPQWEGFQNRTKFMTTNVRPWFDFGWSPTNHAGGESPGEFGGLVFRGDCRYPERMACYADRLESLSLDKPLHASGRVVLTRGVTDSGVLIGFFDSRESMQSNPAQYAGLPQNFFGISTDGPSREGFLFTPTYRLKDGHDGRVPAETSPHLYPGDPSLAWSFDYDPEGANGLGQVNVRLGDKSVSLDLNEGARRSTARFDRFGIVTAWIDGNAQTIYFDDLTYTYKQD
jgi:hypothetical protein